MGFLGDLFDDVVDIASSPVKLGTSVVDAVITMGEDTPLTDGVEYLKDNIKIKGKND